MLKNIIDKLSSGSLGSDDYELFAIVADEVQRNDIDQGIWAKSIAETSGDITKAKSRYIKLRVNYLKKEYLKALEEEQKSLNNLKLKLDKLRLERKTLREDIIRKRQDLEYRKTLLDQIKQREKTLEDELDNFFQKSSTSTKNKVFSNLILVVAAITVAFIFLSSAVPPSLIVWSVFSTAITTLLALYFVSNSYGVVGKISARKCLDLTRSSICQSESWRHDCLQELNKLEQQLSTIDDDIQKISTYLSRHH